MGNVHPARVALGYPADGLMKVRHGSINDVTIADSERLFHWDSDQSRPNDHPDLSDQGL